MFVTPTTRTRAPIVHYRGRRAIKVRLLVVPTQYILKSIIIQTASFRNGHPVFPPPLIHPVMTQPLYHPPGSRIQNVDSFNMRNENMINVNNNNSTISIGMDRSLFSQHPAHGPGAFPTTSSAQFSPRQVQGMSPDYQKGFPMLMQQVQKQTAPAKEEEDPRMTVPVSITTGMSNMSLDEDCPAYLQVKSDPHDLYHSAASAHSISPSNLDPVQPERIQDLPEHMPPNPAVSTSGPYTMYAPASITPWNSWNYPLPPAASPSSAKRLSSPHPGTPHTVPHSIQGGSFTAPRFRTVTPPQPSDVPALAWTESPDFGLASGSLGLGKS